MSNREAKKLDKAQRCQQLNQHHGRRGAPVGLQGRGEHRTMHYRWRCIRCSTSWVGPAEKAMGY